MSCTSSFSQRRQFGPISFACIVRVCIGRTLSFVSYDSLPTQFYCAQPFCLGGCFRLVFWGREGGKRLDPKRIRYGCFLPDLTGLARASSAPSPGGRYRPRGARMRVSRNDEGPLPQRETALPLSAAVLDRLDGINRKPLERPRSSSTDDDNETLDHLLSNLVARVNVGDARRFEKKGASAATLSTVIPRCRASSLLKPGWRASGGPI